MKRSWTAWRDFLLGWLLFGLILSVLLSQDVMHIKYKLSEPLTVWSEEEPAGEIVPGYLLEQELHFKRGIVRDNELDAPVCLEILFATYKRYSNRGRVLLVLKTGSQSVERTLIAAHLGDNEWEMVCFDDIRFSDVLDRTATLQVSGLDSPRGKAVTAWLAKGGREPGARIAGVVHDKQLVYRPYLTIDNERYLVGAWGLILLSAAVLSQLLVAVRSLVTQDRCGRAPPASGQRLG